MRIIEEGYLKRTVAQLNSFATGHKSYADLFADMESFETEPLQDLSFRTDLTYFEEIAFILSVISSIISHPHISNKGENIIIRTELASSVSPEMFQKTMRDPILWSFDGDRMIPEHVHYFQSIDDLRIYENVFLVMLVKLIAAELTKYQDFYTSLIETYHGQETLSLNENNVSVALSKIRVLNKRIRYIQNTRFYKEINKKPTTLRTVHPTNILLKDRLYNYCFKFYRSLVTYPEKEKLMHDFAVYYCMMLMRALSKKGFRPAKNNPQKLRFDGEKSLVIPKLTFESPLYTVETELLEANRGLVLTVENKLVAREENKRAKHLLLFSPQTSFADLNTVSASSYQGYRTVEAISLWNTAYVEEVILPLYRNPLSEQEVMSRWLSTKLSASRASAELYRTFCPACQKASVDCNDTDLRICTSCGSEFTFFRDAENQENLWFLKWRG
ncbi:MAG: hypothetical protein IIU88_01925 [Clostridia bacterium]|nr:hypothetical protein [Clostridia bacterium]